MNNDDLLIQKTTLPTETLSFNEISKNIQFQLNSCYEQNKKFLLEEQNHSSNRKHYIIDYAAVLGR